MAAGRAAGALGTALWLPQPRHVPRRLLLLLLLRFFFFFLFVFFFFVVFFFLFVFFFSWWRLARVRGAPLGCVRRGFVGLRPMAAAQPRIQLLSVPLAVFSNYWLA
mgnify:CR=1 FL=1